MAPLVRTEETWSLPTQWALRLASATGPLKRWQSTKSLCLHRSTQSLLRAGATLTPSQLPLFQLLNCPSFTWTTAPPAR